MPSRLVEGRYGGIKAFDVAKRSAEVAVVDARTHLDPRNAWLLLYTTERFSGSRGSSSEDGTGWGVEELIDHQELP